VDTAQMGSRNNERLFIPATKFNRFAVTREITTGLLAPRFARARGLGYCRGHSTVNPSVACLRGGGRRSTGKIRRMDSYARNYPPHAMDVHCGG